MNKANSPKLEHLQVKSNTAAHVRQVEDGTTRNDRISSLLCRPAKIEPADRAFKITHFLRQGQMIRTCRPGTTAHQPGRAKNTAANITAPPAICCGIIPSPRTSHASNAENGGCASITRAIKPTGTRPIATEVKP
jgi:hypothetical protein